MSGVALIVVDPEGNMTSITVQPPSLYGIPSSSNIVYVDSSGNVGVMSPGDVYTSYRGDARNNIRNLLTIDSNQIFSTISTLRFNPCHVNGDPARNPAATMNGAPQQDGTCRCRNNWSGTKAGDGCAVCDGYGVTHVDGTFGKLAGSDCQYSRKSNCSGHGNVNGSGKCSCDLTYAGSFCQYSDLANCNGHGKVDASGKCTCNPGYAGSSCQYSDLVNCSGAGKVDAAGKCTCDSKHVGPMCQWAFDSSAPGSFSPGMYG